MQTTIRPAEYTDVPAMLALVKELAIFEKEPDAVTISLEEMICPVIRLVPKTKSGLDRMGGGDGE